MMPSTFHQKLDEARQLLLGQQFAQALARYEKLARTFPGQAVVWFEYGNAASRLGQLDKARRAWEKAMALAPRNAELILHDLSGRDPAGLWQFGRALAGL
ncbi:MAG: tetratricopeptide repeat protein [Verrucomicrobia bacterium]|nr:tetratricopeptide repeat protein [Verrucomicrobiota bacterium]